MKSKRVRVNRQIRSPEVRVIGVDGAQLGVMSIDEALRSAGLVSLDLVEISPNADPPVCRVMDHGKYLYTQKKQTGVAKKKQKQTQVKEIKFRPGTDVGDYNIKLRKIITFLERGDRVKISLRFRGREMQHRELGLELLERLKGDLPAGVVVEQEPKLEGRQMTMVVTLGRETRTKKVAQAPVSSEVTKTDNNEE